MICRGGFPKDPFWIRQYCSQMSENAFRKTCDPFFFCGKKFFFFRIFRKNVEFFFNEILTVKNFRNFFFNGSDSAVKNFWNFFTAESDSLKKISKIFRKIQKKNIFATNIRKIRRHLSLGFDIFLCPEDYHSVNRLSFSELLITWWFFNFVVQMIIYNTCIVNKNLQKIFGVYHYKFTSKKYRIKVFFRRFYFFHYNSTNNLKDERNMN